jgi:aminoglycoside phosphotransferase (APT) family kinase protein
MYRMPPHIVAGLGGADIPALGIPSEEEYLAAYCRRRGLDGMPGYDFYIAFNFFRIAAIFHGIKGRVLRGTAASAQAKERVQVLPELMALAWQQAERAQAA